MRRVLPVLLAVALLAPSAGAERTADRGWADSTHPPGLLDVAIIDCSDEARKALVAAVEKFNRIARKADVWLRIRLQPNGSATAEDAGSFVDDPSVQGLDGLVDAAGANVVVACSDQGKYGGLDADTHLLPADGERRGAVIVFPDSPSKRWHGCAGESPYGHAPMKALALHELFHAVGLEAHAKKKDDVFWDEVRVERPPCGEPATKVENPDPGHETLRRVKKIWPCTREARQNAEAFDKKHGDGQGDPMAGKGSPVFRTPDGPVPAEAALP